MSKKFFILTESFPLGGGEAFLETENDYIPSDATIYYCPLCLDAQLKNRDDGKYHNTIIIASNDISLIDRFSGLLSLISGTSLKELYLLLKRKKINYNNLYKLFSLIYNSTIKTKALAKKIKGLIDKNDHVVFYSYWFYLEALCSVKLKSIFGENTYALSRAHGFDIYEERSDGYLPFREYLFANINFVFPVSQNGCEYLAKKYPSFESKILLSRLGTRDYGVSNWKKHEGTFRIISCSYCSPVKRLFLLADSLAEASRIFNIEWTHLGGGQLFERLVEYCENKLDGKVKYDLRGNLSNREIVDVYSHEQFDVFVNVSETEGIPVSIMEAMSFGIPVLATNVGGTSEIVKDGISGYLLQKNFTSSEFISRIEDISEMSYDESSDFRHSVRVYWEKTCDAKLNYKLFYTKLLGI